MEYEIKNARYNHAGTIDLDYNHPVYGWIGFTANPNDIEPMGKILWDLAKKSPVAPYAPNSD